jgi:hypothetical protein
MKKDIEARAVIKNEKNIKVETVYKNEKTSQIELGLDTQLQEKHHSKNATNTHNTLKSTQAHNSTESDFTNKDTSSLKSSQASNRIKTDFTSEYKNPRKLTQTDNHTRSDFTSEYKSPRKLTNTNSLYLAIFKLIRYLYTLIRNFPKEYKYTLGEDTIKLAWATLDCVASANILPINEKKAYILKASLTFDKLKFRLRLSHELKLVSN